MDEWTPPNSQYPPPKPGEPALHAAARLGDHAKIREVVAGGAPIDAVFDMGLDPGAYPSEMSALMVAAGSGDGASVATVRLLLELGADPTLRTRWWSAATCACQGLGWNYRPGGDTERLELLLSMGSPLPTNASSANRVLCKAAENGDAARLRVLLKHGLDARGYFDPEEARKGHLAMVQMMESQRAAHPGLFPKLSGEIQTSMDETMRQLEAERLSECMSAPSSFQIPLFCAAESGSEECVRMLLDAGADPMQRDDCKQTAMYYAASLGVIRVLMNAGLPIEDQDKYGCGPLCNAMSDGEDGIERIRAYIDAGANVNAVHDRGYTVFMSAIGSSRHPSVYRLLVERGADPHVVSELGYNAWHAAIDVSGEANSEESVRAIFSYLKELGVDPEHRNNLGETPLAYAISRGTGIEVRELCAAGANPNAVCEFYRCGNDACKSAELSLLFHAVFGTGIDKDVKTDALLRAGATPSAKDTEGITVLGRAVAELCAQAADYQGTYRRFFEGLRAATAAFAELPNEREPFIATVEPPFAEYVNEFAAATPLADSDEFAEKHRAAIVGCICSLASYECWAWWAARPSKDDEHSGASAR
ncbi:MAG: ankyrin repeat domain-containing protein [Phycisphaerales bacterium]